MAAFLGADGWEMCAGEDAGMHEGHRRRSSTEGVMQSAATSRPVRQSPSGLAGPTMSDPGQGNQAGGDLGCRPGTAAGRCCTGESARAGTGVGNERVGAE